MRSDLHWNPFSFALIGLSASAIEQDLVYQHVVVDANYPKRVHCETVGDINGEGYPDLAGANHGNRGVGDRWHWQLVDFRLHTPRGTVFGRSELTEGSKVHRALV
jgi:hypothetical protein